MAALEEQRVSLSVKRKWDNADTYYGPATTRNKSSGEFRLPSSIKIPDLFSEKLYGVWNPEVNPHYATVKDAGDSWVSKLLKMNEKATRKYSKVDFALLSSLWLPDADEEKLRLMLDWNCWSFTMDDRFDQGDLRDDLFVASRESIRSLAILDENHPVVSSEDNALRHIFQTVWFRLKEQASSDMQLRFKENHRDTFIAMLEQVNWINGGYASSITIDEYLENRRGSIGTYPLFTVLEWANGIDLPRHIMDHPCIKTCATAMTDIVILTNDILSVPKDLTAGITYNSVIILMRDMSLQEGVDKVGSMLEELYDLWFATIERLPKWGFHINDQVLKLLEVYRLVSIGALEWYFRSGRYLGDASNLRETRVMQI